ncbi:zinc-binding dehydrogenase [Paraglaciecola aquimarina]|uniref:Zinc-binding dehydrogenase n=1 Tax=Paraglaciecola aquimarina TaxID=1235557 RepID=A0ABU3SZW7_9ALTE|nr:zinc-binding dehydrogenase [Paraglaciecola aquimarina]MDU0355559.1 zinc-binding dehydrogenase [Paraglaciecola aquimarina]
MANVANSMQAITLAKAEENFILRKQQVPTPVRQESELLIRVEYVGLNPIDAKLAKSGFAEWQYPHVLGLDAVGTVVDAPVDVSPNVGDQVMWHANIRQQGMLADYVAVPNFAVSKLPEGLSPQTAAALPSAGMAALVALDKLQIKGGEKLLVEAGAGAVGQFAIQFAKQRGAIIFTTAAKKTHTYLKKIGADECFDYNDKQLLKKFKMALGHSEFDAVVDSIGGDNTIRNIELVRFCGKIACLNGLPAIPPDLLFFKAPMINIVSLSGAYLTHSLCAQQRMSFMGNLLMNSVNDGSIKTPSIIPIAYEAEAITQALQRQLQGDVFGKQVVSVTG